MLPKNYADLAVVGIRKFMPADLATVSITADTKEIDYLTFRKNDFQVTRHLVKINRKQRVNWFCNEKTANCSCELSLQFRSICLIMSGCRIFSVCIVC